MALYTKYNNENILSRSILAGILNVLNNNINYNQTWDNDDVEQINIPWYPNQSGDERFMQDFYTSYKEYCPPLSIDGNMDIIPRGVITYNGSNISNQRMTSRFVLGHYLKEVSGNLQSYVSYLYSIPLNIPIECELWIDTYTTALKIEQAIIQTFYKTVTFYVYFKGLRVGCTAGFPENVALEKNIRYSFEEDNKIKITFSIEIESYMPVFDQTSEMNSNNRIKGFGMRLYDANERGDGNITITYPNEDIIIPKGTQSIIEWNYDSEGAIIYKVNAYYSEYPNENSWTQIEQGIFNHGYYLWNIPQNFTDFKEPIISFDNTDDVHVIREPNIKVIPDLSTGEISAQSFKILEPGYFYTGNIFDSSINIVLEMINSSGQTVYTDDGDIALNITDGKINQNAPINYIKSGLEYTADIDYKIINLFIANSVNKDVFGVTKNIKIV